MYEDLRGKIAVVTGGARGLGLQMATALAAHGAEIALIDLLPEVTESAARLAQTKLVRTVGISADVTNADSIGGRRRGDRRIAGYAVDPDQRGGDHRMGRFDRRHAGEVAQGHRRQPDRHVLQLSGVRPVRLRRERRWRDRQRLVDVGVRGEHPAAPGVLQRIQGGHRPADEIACRRMDLQGHSSERRCARLLPVRHDPTVPGLQCRTGQSTGTT